MKLKQVITLLFAVLFVHVVFTSCTNSDDQVHTSSSADAQIYSFKLSALPVTAIDTINYKVLAKTKFSIDQRDNVIYNYDSLPYQTRIGTFHVAAAFASSSPSRLQLRGYDGTTTEWNGADSVVFAGGETEPEVQIMALKASTEHPLPTLIVTAANGRTQKEYRIEIRVHQVDPDLIVWKNMTETFNQPASITKEQKTLLANNRFYTFTFDINNKLNLYIAEKGSAYDPTPQVSDLPSNTLLESIIFFKGNFYAMDADNKGYSSQDGVLWNPQSSNVHSILGILPADTEEDDVLLVLAKNDGGKCCLATTTDLLNLNLHSELGGDFPISGFSSTTSYNRIDQSRNILSMTGGVTIGGEETSRTWSVQIAGDKSVRYISNQSNYIFPAKKGIVSFMYDNYLFALTDNKLYKSISFGSLWKAAPEKESLSAAMPKVSGQSVLVDEDNYIWVFGGMTDSNSTTNEVWRGRLNRLNTK